MIRNFGPVGSANAFGTGLGTTLPAPANPYELVSEAIAAFSQATTGGSMGIYCLRAVDGTMYAQGGTPGTGGSGQNTTGTYAALILNDTAGSPVAGLTLYGLYLGTLGNAIKITLATGNKGTGFVTVTVTPPGGLGLTAEVYPNIPTASGTFNNISYAGLFWPTLAGYLMNGVPSGRGPSQLLFAYQGSTGTGHPSTTAVTPAIVTNAALTGGLDGDTFVASGFAGTNNLPVNMIGQNTTFPATGLFTLGMVNPPIAAFRVAGFGEASGDLAAAGTTIQAIADSLGALTFFGFPIGDDSATGTAVAAVTTAGIDDFEVIYVKDHAYWNDGTSGARFFPMAPFAMGDVLAGQPQDSPLNTAVQSVIGTYRNVSAGAPAPYSQAEIGACQTGRISLIAKPSPGGSYTGWNTAVNSSSNAVISPIEYGSLTNTIAKSLAAGMGKYVGGNQSPVDPQDPLRSAVEGELNKYLQQLVFSKSVAAGFAVCDLTNNTANTIAAHYLFATAQATYFASVWFFLLSFTGGTTVQVRVTQGASA